MEQELKDPKLIAKLVPEYVNSIGRFVVQACYSSGVMSLFVQLRRLVPPSHAMRSLHGSVSGETVSSLSCLVPPLKFGPPSP
jgi:hypothetical protein